MKWRIKPYYKWSELCDVFQLFFVWNLKAAKWGIFWLWFVGNICLNVWWNDIKLTNCDTKYVIQFVQRKTRWFKSGKVFEIVPRFGTHNIWKYHPCPDLFKTNFRSPSETLDKTYFWCQFTKESPILKKKWS